MALLAAVAASGCSAPIPPSWTMVTVVNGADGAVVVWRRAEYRGGEFNGFDNNPVLVSRASYRGFRVEESGGGFGVSPVPVDFSYRSWRDPTDRPGFRYSGTRLTANHCQRRLPKVDGSGGCSGGLPDELWVAQLGRRDEELGIAGRMILVGSPDRPTCSLPLRDSVGGWIGDDLRGDEDAWIGVAYFPASATAYLVLGGSRERIEVLVSRGCGAFRGIDAASAAILADLAGLSDSTSIRFVSVRDIVATDDPDRPALLLQWSQDVNGVFQSRTGVVDLAAGSVDVLPEELRYPLGFWRGSPSHVLVGVDEVGERGGRGAASLVLYDTESSSTRSIPLDFPLGRR